jgi:hypothetical protein
VRRVGILWLVCFAAYAVTLGLPSFGASEYGGDEPHYLLVAESIVSDADIDLTDEYAGRDYAAFYPYDLDRHGRPYRGRQHEPHGIGFPLLITPAYALGAARGVEWFLAALAALAFALCVPLVRRVVPEPWATRGVLTVALSPPALAYGTAVYPELAAGGALVAGAALALRGREEPRLRYAYASAAALATLPWLGPKYLIPALPIGVMLVRWTARRGRRLAAIGVSEVMTGSLVLYATFNERLYGGFTPYAVDPDGAADAAVWETAADRLPRLAALWVDREYGLLRWAPIFALAFLGAWLLWRSRREQLVRAIPERRDAEVAAALALAVCAGAVAVAAFGSPTMFGFWFPPRHLVAGLPVATVLVAWGWQHAPRLGAALALLTAVSSTWLLVALHTGAAGGWVRPDTQAPLGPAVDLLPLYGAESAGATVWTAVLGVGLAALGVREWRRWSRNRRQTAGTTRRAYTP